MSNSCKEFRISETVKNISRFIDKEDYFTDTEERFNIPWRMGIRKRNGYFEFYLRCEKDECENRKWSIETELTLKLISCNGKSLTKTGTYTFEKPIGNGWSDFISWKELKSDYMVDDSIVVEAHVKIFKITDSPCTENENQKIFLLNHTVRNVSSIKEGSNYFTKTEKRFNIPWSLRIHRENGFFGLCLQCEKEQSNRRNWTVEVDYKLKLISVNGQNVSLQLRYIFNKPYG
ncbi:MATH domain-containing protein [Caenorhabditis elegans]|uniref:MATH domain-containing protein n=1 Tax=Caenorhabditis elegans TaxID=6239 RepID=Q9N487_CAEEL|nr:MATH domain-containing protein [Caenorhabditis elegans]CCD67125.2 MATH domain-containing protein [Caenorhabditis elegans]